MAQLQPRVSKKIVNDTLKEAIKPKAADVPALKVMQLQPAKKSLSSSEANSLKVAQPQNIPTKLGNLEAKSGDDIALKLAAETPTTKNATEEAKTYISSDEITQGANAFYNNETKKDDAPAEETPKTDTPAETQQTTKTPADTKQTTTPAWNPAPEIMTTVVYVPSSGNSGQTPAAAPSLTNTSSSNTASNKDGNKMPIYIGLAIAAVVIILFITK